MSNHARGLWGYSGRTASGRELSIQATGMGGPSAALVLADMAKLGVRRVVRVGTCAALGGRAELGELVVPHRALAAGGSASAFGLRPGAAAAPDAELLDRLRERLEAPDVAVTSLDTMAASDEAPGEAVAADMQTVTVLARARELGVAAAAILIVSEVGGERLGDEALEAMAKRAGAAASAALLDP